MCNIYFFPVKAEETSESESRFTSAITINGSSFSADYVEGEDHFLAGKAAAGILKLRTSGQISISGILPQSSTKISNVCSTVDAMIGSDQYTIMYDTDSENNSTYEIKYTIDAYSIYILNGSLCFEIELDTNGEKDTYIVVYYTTANLATAMYGNVSAINMVDVKNDEILMDESEFTSLGSGIDKYKFIESDIDTISFMVNRTQDDIYPLLKSISSLNPSGRWLSIGCNYISVNGGEAQRFDVCSRQGDRNYSQSITLEKGYNLINLFFLSGTNYEMMSRSTCENIWLPFPGTTALSANDTGRAYMISIPYIIYYDGESEEYLSNDANLKSLDPISWGYDSRDMMSIYGYEIDQEVAKATIVIPRNSVNNKLILGIIPNTAGSIIEIDGESEKTVCGNYHVINPESLGLDDTGEDYSFTIHVTAPDGVTKKDYTVDVIRRSSDCNLTSIDISGASVDGLLDLLANDEESFIMKLDSNESNITFSNIEVSDYATVTVDGKTMEKGESITVSAGDITRLEIMAEDGITTRLYLFLHQKEDGTLPYFTISDSTKKMASELLEGWYSRSEAEKKKVGDAWGVFEAVATDTKESNNLDGTAVDDLVNYTYSQSTDYSKIILELVMLGENPYEYVNQDGENLVAWLLRDKHWSGAYTTNIWSLMALRAAGAEIPDGLVDSVEAMAANKTFDLDMRAWAFGAVSDLVSLTRCAALAEGFRNTLLTEGDQAGMFYNDWYTYANVISHGCVLEGMAAAGIDVDKQFAVSDTASPLKTLYNYLTENGHFKYDKAAADADWSNVWAKDTIIGLGDLIHGDNVWKRYALTLDKYDSLLKIASECYGEDGSSITDENLRTALYNALETANTARAEAEDIQGLGSQYYALYAAVADIDYTLVGQPQVRICTYEQCIQVDDAIAAINELSDLNIVTQELVDKANNVYAALGEDDEELKAKLQGYVTNDDLISRAEEFLAFAVKADAVGSITKDSGEAIAAAEEAYAQLSDSLKQEEAVITRYKTLLEGRSLYDVIHAIETLPAIDQLTINDQETVEVLWTSYNALSNELKAQVTNASVLVQANSRMKDLTAANQVEELINSLPDAENISYENGDWDAIQTAYREYNSLTDAQKELVSAEVVEKLDADYEALKQQQSDAQAVQEVIDNIDALPPTDELTLEYNLLIKSIRGLYDSLSTDALRERVTNIETLNNAEARMMELRKTDLLSLIAALPEVEEVSGTNPDGSDIVMTQDMISAIAAAVSTYQAMDEAEQKIFANENPAPYEKMITLDSIAGEYEGYIEEVLAPLAADIAFLNFLLPGTIWEQQAI